MCNRILLLLLLAVPLAAADVDPLLAELWPENTPKTKTIADEAEANLLQWLHSLTQAGEHPQTHFDEGVPYSIVEVDTKRKGLVVRKLERDSVDADGKVNYRVVGDKEARKIAQWPSRYAVLTFGIEGREDKEVVGFAVWLYERAKKKDEWEGNRVLTALYQRNEKLQPLIQAWIIKHNYGDKAGTELKLGEVWDAEFRKARPVLINAADEEKLKKAREQAGKDEYATIETEFTKPAKRKLTLEQILAALAAWELEFKPDENQQKKVSGLRGALERAVKQATEDAEKGRAAASEAESFKSDQRNDKARGKWKEAAELYEAALARDSANMQLVSAAANAWLQAGDPEFFQAEDRWGCTNEGFVKKALPHYARLVEAQPTHVRTLMAQGMCLQLVGQKTKAIEVYRRVLALAPGTADSDEANRRMEQLNKR